MNGHQQWQQKKASTAMTQAYPNRQWNMSANGQEAHCPLSGDGVSSFQNEASR